MRLLYAILLLLTGLLFWYLANNYCNCNVQETSKIEEAVAPVAALPMTKLSPIGFACSGSSPKYEAKWAAFKDSLQNSLKENQILEIMGYSFIDESAVDGKTLASLRAQNVRSQFQLDDDKVRINSQIREETCREEEMYNMIRFRILRNSTKIKEVGDRTLIYFPSNSTDKLADAEIEAYLNDVADRVIKSGETVQLTGHTDATGNRNSNIRLGQGRADTIKNYLLGKGVSAGQISTSSQGPDSPIADNSSAEGRAQNRRTELRII